MFWFVICCAGGGGGGPKYSADLHTMKMENDNNVDNNKDCKLPRLPTGFLEEDYEEDKSDSSNSSKANDNEERIDSGSTSSPADPFSQGKEKMLFILYFYFLCQLLMIY